MVRDTSTDALSKIFQKCQLGCRAFVSEVIGVWSAIAARLQPLLDDHATPDHHCQNIVRVAVAFDESA